MPDNGKNIDKAKQKALDALKDRINDMSAAAYAILLQVIEDNFDISEGKILPSKSFISKLNKLTVQVLDLLQSDPKFTGPISGFVKRLTPISESITDFQKITNGVNVPAFEIQKKIAIDEILDQMLNNGLNQSFVQPLRDLIYQNVTSDLSLKEAKFQIKQMSNEKLGRYVEQTAQQAVDSYSGLINKKILENFDMNGLLITGSLIDNSSPQCRYVIEELGGKITRENWPQVVAKATKRFPLIKGTTFDNLPLNRLHWGCRHSFYPIKIKQTA